LVVLMMMASATAALAGGCGDIDGGQQPFAGTVLYQDIQGQFQLRLLAPPWVAVPPVMPGVTIFVVMPDALTIDSTESDAPYSLDVAVASGDAASALRAAAAAASPPWDLSKQRNVRTASGATGGEIDWQEAGPVYHREVFAGAPTTSAFHLHFSAKTPIADDVMISQMILSFAPKTAAVSPGGGAR
jgi:hypothetical protein